MGVDRGDDKKPDGITVFPFSRGESLCRDVTCVDTFAETNLDSSAVAPGYAARKTEESKRRKYSALEARFRFEPITAVETTGVYGVTPNERRAACRVSFPVHSCIPDTSQLCGEYLRYKSYNMHYNAHVLC